jgi:hypothetical protein
MENRRKYHRTSKDQAYAMSLAGYAGDVSNGTLRGEVVEEEAPKKRKKSSSSSASSSWSCEGCTFLNPNKLQKCRICGTYKSNKGKNNNNKTINEETVVKKSKNNNNVKNDGEGGNDEVSEEVDFVLSPPSAESITQNYPPYMGGKVKVKFDNEKWYGGEIVSVNGKSFVIKYDDGADETCDSDNMQDVIVLAQPPPKLSCLRQKESGIGQEESSEEGNNTMQGVGKVD